MTTQNLVPTRPRHRGMFPFTAPMGGNPALAPGGPSPSPPGTQQQGDAASIMQQMMLRGQRALLLETDRRLLPRISGSIKPGASPWVRTAPASAQPADELDEIEPIKAPAPEPKVMEHLDHNPC